MTTKAVLIVDDDEVSRNEARDILVSLGVDNIRMAKDGYEAERILASGPHPDLIMCDIVMPERDGIELVSDLVKVDYCGGLILMSSKGAQFMDLTRLLARRKKLNLLATLNKPLVAEEVVKAIEGFAGGIRIFV